MLINRVRRIGAAVLVLALAPALAGCFANPLEQAFERGVENSVRDLVKDATGLDVEVGGELPSNFPREVPLIDGPVTFGSGLATDDGYAWTIQVDVGDPESQFDRAYALLIDAGFEPKGETDMTGMRTAMLDRAPYHVTLSYLGTSDKNPNLSYMVIRIDE